MTSLQETLLEKKSLLAIDFLKSFEIKLIFLKLNKYNFFELDIFISLITSFLIS